MSSPSSLQPMVRKLGYWHPMEEEDKEALLALPHRVRAVDAHHYLVRERERPRTLA
jgi:hypothetical protein